MNEGQGAAAPPLPGGADDAPAMSVSAVAEPAMTPSAALLEVETAGTDPPDEGGPHVRVDARKLEQALLDMRGPVASLRLVLDGPGVEAARADQQQLLSQIDDYLLPRLRQSGAPILIAMVANIHLGRLHRGAAR